MEDRGQASIRAFRPDDVIAVEHLILATIDAAYSGLYPPRAIDYFKALHSSDRILARAEEGAVVVAERDSKIVGTGSLVGREIGGVFVRPDAQRVGIGTLLMDWLEEFASSVGLQSVSLFVSLPSRAFYERRGYTLSEMLSGDMGEGQALDYWVADKSIADGES